MLHITKPIIFLDVDGVLNSPQFFKTVSAMGKKGVENRIDPLCVNKLQTLVDKTDAVVVISSTWRRYDEDLFQLMQFFSDYAIPVIGMTKYIDGYRSHEIMQWLQDHYVTHNCFIAIDDDSADLKELKSQLIKVDGSRGLTELDIQCAAEEIGRRRKTVEDDKKTDNIERLSKLKKSPWIHG